MPILANLVYTKQWQTYCVTVTIVFAYSTLRLIVCIYRDSVIFVSEV